LKRMVMNRIAAVHTTNLLSRARAV